MCCARGVLVLVVAVASSGNKSRRVLERQQFTTRRLNRRDGGREAVTAATQLCEQAKCFRIGGGTELGLCRDLRVQEAPKFRNEVCFDGVSVNLLAAPRERGLSPPGRCYGL